MPFNSIWIDVHQHHHEALNTRGKLETTCLDSQRPQRMKRPAHIISTILCHYAEAYQTGAEAEAEAVDVSFSADDIGGDATAGPAAATSTQTPAASNTAPPWQQDRPPDGAPVSQQPGHPEAQPHPQQQAAGVGGPPPPQFAGVSMPMPPLGALPPPGFPFSQVTFNDA